MKKKILIIEDDLVAQHLLRDLLTEAGYDVESIVDGAEITSDIGVLNVDLILLDMMIPHMYESSDLIGLYKNLKTPIIVMSSIDREDGEYFTKQINASLFFEKPLDSDSLLESINSILNTNTSKNENTLEHV